MQKGPQRNDCWQASRNWLGPTSIQEHSGWPSVSSISRPWIFLGGLADRCMCCDLDCKRFPFSSLQGSDLVVVCLVGIVSALQVFYFSFLVTGFGPTVPEETVQVVNIVFSRADLL